MSFLLECKKIRRTGFLVAFLFGGILAAAVPIANMAVRSENYLWLSGTPVEILLNANWQMMAMLNILLVSAGACILYHTEYADNAFQKINTLPVSQSNVFFGKFILTLLVMIGVIAVEFAAVLFSAVHWFAENDTVFSELCKNFAFSLLMIIPCLVMSLIISSAFKNMWISLGISVVCVCAASMIPTDNFALTLFPFALPFQTLSSFSHDTTVNYIIAAFAEFGVLSAVECVFLKVRRSFE